MTVQHSHRLTTTNLALSLALSAALFALYWTLGSALAFAQAADSLLDALTAALLAWAVRIASRPGDAEHPAGHHSAEPLVALWVAALALLLAYRVIADAVGALWSGQAVQFSVPLLVTFAVKAVARGGLVLAIDRTPEASRGPALSALRVDARNDALLATGSVGASLASRWVPWADPAVALPMALWIGWSGYALARDNAQLLMGRAPSEQRLTELRTVAEGVEGVRGVHQLTAHALGAQLGVRVHIEVDPALLAGEAHDLGERVRVAIEAEADVDRCDVHIDVEADHDAP